ncbi:unnamed protein product [Cylicocyclus nassatus]|uniref:Peptidase M28 domain-containing protein n=1 Tax=Cylicocyclus nassatus TaxID=53992 RepID=A0AA36GX53_CYLNA|nr:unnamed protein product [Cylicocyclus nassatus]
MFVFCSKIVLSDVTERARFMLRIALLLSFSVNTYCHIADVDRLEHDIAKFLAMPRYTSSQKARARMGIRHALDAIGLQATTHAFIPDEEDDLGVNLHAIQRGPHYDSPNDKVVVLCANYDTEKDNPGVDDNGSGVAAVLETARAMSTLDRLYKRNHTIIYAFFDMKHKNLNHDLPVQCVLFHTMAGSHAFVEEVLLPYLMRVHATVTAVMVLDGVLHFDPFPATQSTPDGFEEVFPTAARELYEHNHMGGFIQLIARADRDDLLVKQFLAAYYRSATMTAVNSPFSPWLLLLRLPIDAVQSNEDLHRLHPYLFADHSSFIFHSTPDIDLPIIYLTDTLNRRGVLQYCSHCGGLYMLTKENLRFLTVVTDAIIRTVIQMSESEAYTVVDELYFDQSAR